MIYLLLILYQQLYPDFAWHCVKAMWPLLLNRRAPWRRWSRESHILLYWPHFDEIIVHPSRTAYSVRPMILILRCSELVAAIFSAIPDLFTIQNVVNDKNCSFIVIPSHTDVLIILLSFHPTQMFSFNVWSSGIWISTSTGSTAAIHAAGGDVMDLRTRKWDISSLIFLDIIYAVNPIHFPSFFQPPVLLPILIFLLVSSPICLSPLPHTHALRPISYQVTSILDSCLYNSWLWSYNTSFV